MIRIVAVGVAVLVLGWFGVVFAVWRPRKTTRIIGSFAGGLLDRYRIDRERTLEAAHVSTDCRQYAALTLVYSLGAALSGAVFCGFLFVFLLAIFDVSPVALAVITAITAGWSAVVSGIGCYWLRWWWPGHIAAARGRHIDATMPRTVAFLYALSRSGMPVPEILRAFGENETVYGEAATEISLTVREMDLAGADLLTALETTARRTPSEEFEEFLSNLTSVLRTGRSLPAFLETQYERYQDEATAKQNRVLTQLATLAEVYVTALVAGPLFLLTILVVIGLTIEDTLSALVVLVYLVLPLANLAFVIYLSTLTEPVRSAEIGSTDETALGGILNVRRREQSEASQGAPELRSDGGTARTVNEERLDFYERYRVLINRLSRPFETVRERPERLLYLTAPLAALVILVRIAEPLSRGALDARVLDDVLVQSALFVLGTYGAVAAHRERRTKRIERALPDVLSRLASINEAGVSVTDSLGRVRRGDLGVLSREFDRIWRDIEWGGDTERALWRFERRIESASVTRTVALVTNALAASGRLAPVFRIAAEQGHAQRRLARDRRQELITYLVVIYLSFFVFLLIIVVLDSVLIPSLPEPTEELQGVGANFGGVDTDAYTLVFSHALLIQGAMSGYIAGRMGGASVRSGAKHATILLAIAYLAVLVI